VGCFGDGKSILELNVPANVLFVLINRNNKFITPNGATIIQGGDKVLVMTDNILELQELNRCLGVTEVN
jgi:cell volume regulation protein A